MPLSRYQIRNEYSLADPELYRAADKDDPEALLEGVAMAGLVGFLRQLGDLAEFAAEIFHDLHEEVMATAARGHGLMIRVQQLETEVPLIEKAFLSQTSHSSFFYNTGVDWHPNLRMDQNLITREDLPRFIMDSYEECRGPPRLFLLDKFDVAGAGACLKRYTDPSFFKVEEASSKMTNAEIQREKKTRKARKKGSRWRNGETPDVLPTPHAKLHQLFLEEHVENGVADPARHVKLKRRLNGFPFDSKMGKSYMEKFLKTPSPQHKMDSEFLVSSSPLRLSSNVSSDSGAEIHEISMVSPGKESVPRKRSACSSPNPEKIVLNSSISDVHEDVSNAESLTVTESNHTVEPGISSHEKEIVVDGESKTEGSVDGYHSDDIASEVDNDNYMDALATMESEMETEIEFRDKNDQGFFNIEKQGTDSDVTEEQLQANFSDSQSIINSTASDDGNYSFRRSISNFSNSDARSTSAENVPLGGDFSAEVIVKSTTSDDGNSSFRKGTSSVENVTLDGDISDNVFPSEIHEGGIINMSLDHISTNQEIIVSQPPEHLVSSGGIGISKITSSSEFGEPSSSSSHLDSAPTILREDPGAILTYDTDAGAETAAASSNSEKDGNRVHPNSSGIGKITSLSELRDPSSCSSHLDSAPTILRDDARAILTYDTLAGAETEASSSNCEKDGNRVPGSDENGNKLGDNSPCCTFNLSDVLYWERRDFPFAGSAEDHPVGEICEDSNEFSVASNHSSNMLEEAPGGKCIESLPDEVLQTEYVQDNCTENFVESHDSSVDLVFSQEQPIHPALPEYEIGDPNGIVSEVFDAIPKVGDISVNLTPAVDGLGSCNLNKQQVSEITDDVWQPELDSAEVCDLCSEDKHVDEILSTADGEELGDGNINMDLAGSDAILVKFPSHPKSLDSASLMEVHVHSDGTIQSETLVVAASVGHPDHDATEENGCSLSTNPGKFLEESCSIGVTDRDELEINDVCPPEIHEELDIQGEANEMAVASTNLGSIMCNTVSFDHFESHMLNCVPDTSLIAEVGNRLHVHDATMVPSSLGQDSPDSESKSPWQSDLSDNLEDSVSCVPDSSMVAEAENNFHVHDATMVPSSSKQSSLDSESKSSQQNNVINSIEDDLASVLSQLAVTSSDSDINLCSTVSDDHSERRLLNGVRDLSLAAEPKNSLHLDAGSGVTSSAEYSSQNSESSQQSTLNKKPKDAASSPAHNFVDPSFSEENVNLQDNQLDVDSLHTREATSEFFPQLEEIQTSSHMNHESQFDSSRESCPEDVSKLSSASLSSIQKIDIPEPAMDPLSSTFPGFGLLPEATEISFQEMPPLPPLPPVQWRMGKLQSTSLASESDLVQPNLAPFPHVVPSAADKKIQLGYTAMEGKIDQLLNPFLLFPAIMDDNSRHFYEDLMGNMVHSNQFPLQMPMGFDHGSNLDDALTLGRVQSVNPFLTLPATYTEIPQSGFHAGEDRKMLPDSRSFSPVTTTADTDSTYFSGSSHKKPFEPPHQVVPETSSEDKKLDCSSAILKEEVANAHNTISPPPGIEDRHPQDVFATSDGEITWSTGEEGRPNGNRSGKLNRPRSPLIDAVAAHDKSKLRKVTERVRPQIQKVDERDSLLEQIRTKSFNLRPAVMTKPSIIQGPKTNLKVAAILEKANAIRQALAGSDEDDDADSWSE